eukprot:Platyproteum_vivax@DN16423_c0_g1_i1.p1
MELANASNSNETPRFNPHAVPLNPTVVSVQVEGLDYRYQFSNYDLQLVFSKFGNVLSVEAMPGSCVGYIRYEDTSEALRAFNVLNGFFLDCVGRSLKLELME